MSGSTRADLKLVGESEGAAFESGREDVRQEYGVRVWES